MCFMIMAHGEMNIKKIMSKFGIKELLSGYLEQRRYDYITLTYTYRESGVEQSL